MPSNWHEPWSGGGRPADGGYLVHPVTGPPNRHRLVAWLISALVLVAAVAIGVPLLLVHPIAGSAIPAPVGAGASAPRSQPGPADKPIYLSIGAGTGQPLAWGSTPMYDA